MEKFILVGEKVVLEPDLIKWGKWFEKANRHVAVTKVGKVRVSTVFLGLDHSFGGSTPLFFETMVFGGELNGQEERYATWKEAQEGHAKMVERVKKRRRHGDSERKTKV